MGLAARAIICLGILLMVLWEGQADTPPFFSLPRTPVDFVRIFMHGLEVLVLSWFFAGPVIVGIHSLYIAAQISLGLCLALAISTAATKPIDARFAPTGYRISFYVGLISLPYMFLMT
jgi:hypothetical protein